MPVLDWDEAKRRSNLSKHGLDFVDAHLVYDSAEKVTLHSPRNKEIRYLDIALVEAAEAVLALAYIEREENVRVISFRRASRRERRKYEQAKEQD